MEGFYILHGGRTCISCLPCRFVHLPFPGHLGQPDGGLGDLGSIPPVLLQPGRSNSAGYKLSEAIQNSTPTVGGSIAQHPHSHPGTASAGGGLVAPPGKDHPIHPPGTSTINGPLEENFRSQYDASCACLSRDRLTHSLYRVE